MNGGLGGSSLRLRLVLWLLTPLLVLLALDASLTYHRARAASNAAFDRVLYASIKQIQGGVRLREGRVDVDIPYTAFEVFEATALGRLFYRVVEENGPGSTGYEDLPLPPRRTAAFFRPVYYDAEYRGEPVRAVAVRMPLHDFSAAPARVVWIAVAETPELRNELARDILLGSVLQEAVLVALALVIFVFAGRAVLKPIHAIGARVANRDEEHATPLDMAEFPKELSPLTDALNQYTQRMREMLVARRRFFDDAAHQLKTPLASARAQLELALREPLAPALRASLARVLDTLRAASGGVGKLLSLARLEPDSGRRYGLDRIDLAPVVRETLLQWLALARARGVDLGYEGDAQVRADAEASLVEELLANLLDNALLYAGPGARVTVSLLQQPQPTLKVADTGPGIPGEQRAWVFKRFYRVAGTGQPGTGLGLAIVREICRVHGAQVELEDTPGGGLTVVVRFPAPAAEPGAAAADLTAP